MRSLTPASRAAYGSRSAQQRPVCPGPDPGWGFSCMIEGSTKTILLDMGGDTNASGSQTESDCGALEGRETSNQDDVLVLSFLGRCVFAFSTGVHTWYLGRHQKGAQCDRS
jgi:hypothetical protein